MRKTLLAAAALGLLAGAPAIASAATADAAQPAATQTAPAHGAVWQRLFNHQIDAQKYGDPFDAGQRRPGRIILAPVGA